jgi:molecular chaperone IbpA
MLATKTIVHRRAVRPSFRFNSADYVKVAKANLVNGLLTIELVREIPEAMRPRQIQIGGTAQQPEQIEQKAA